ncbi:DHA2 family efflux MFS transporter permease subunit [Limosilactobacillus sp. RRLNB_1_1]|uniref:DHA2 family efflux MFS transporter permease subunit n=1 Tax=Limosilactobacillus albertensis TaxID=2759752 RepID=A0A7W3TQ41_9LACO|nr:DHA2 family efflux MFS transporter permease subunit [Limosilactobacillus albertensis]MBB1068799.1 DHA2 family efflux MFS transporter permease subunit [Limosilactobacillus albertensis]MCD7117765.1 DHA2 family efflux MFS transporter permease subunit [Limosilactobacillus albertensis]MCD7129215.1 DHA2 family efflux MFS transporter permease subunit [Limosilactobacillus albertensis]
MENALQARQHVSHPKLAMVSMLLGAFVGMFSETSLNIALPKLIAVFQVSTATIQWLVTGYMLIIGIILPLSSIITKWFTTRQVIIFALVDFIIGACISALANSFSILVIGRMIQGIGTGLILPLMFAVAMQIFPPKEIGAVMGMCALVIMFAPAIGPTLTGLILAKLSWQWIFWFFIPFLLVALIFAIASLENVGELTKPHVDVLSILESAVGCSGIVIGASLASRDGWLSLPVLGSLIIGIIVLGLYAHRQVHLENPILNLRIFKIPAFAIGSSLVMLDFGIILSTMYLLPMFYQNGLLLPVALTGIVMLPGGVINALTSAFAGRLYDNIGAKKPVIIGFVIALIGAVMLAFTTPSTSIAYMIVAHIILMIGCPLAMSPSQTSALNALSGIESGDGSTIMNTMQQVIGALATALATSFLALGSATATGSTALRFTNGFHYGIYFAIVLIIIAILLSFKIHDQRR